jgi:hypothetical protein
MWQSKWRRMKSAQRRGGDFLLANASLAVFAVDF